MNKYFHKILLICVTLGLFACSGDPTGAKNLEDAKQFISEGKSKAATIELKNTLQKDEGNQEARWLLGKLYLESGDYANAIKELDRALELGQSHDDVLPLLAEAYLAVGDKEKLAGLPVANLTSASSRAFVLAAQGLGILSRERIEEAASLVSRAIEEDPQSAFALVADTRITALQSNGQFDEVLRKLNHVLEIDPGYAPALSLLADIEFQTARLNLAEQSYSKAIDAGSKNLEDYYKRALVRLQLGDVEGAEKDIKALAQRVPNHPGVYYLKGLIFFQEQNFKDAISSFEVSSKFETRYPMSLLYLGLAHNIEGNFRQAEDFAYRFLSIVPDNAAGRRLLAGLKVKSGEAEEAQELLTPLLEQSPDDANALNILAKALMMQGKKQESIDLLARIAKLQPDSAEARLRLGASLLSSGQEEMGLQQIQSARDLNPELQQADILIVAAHLRDGDYDGAMKAVDKFAEKNPNSEVTHNLRGRIYLASQKEQEARVSFGKALDLDPGNLTAIHNLAFLAVKDNQKDQAKNYYLEALKYHDNDLGILLKLIALEEINKNYDAMVAYMERGLKAHPGSAYLKVLMARYHILQGKPEQVPVALGDMDVNQRNLPDVINVLGLSQLERGQFFEAKNSFEKLSKSRPDAPQARFHLGKAYLGLNDKAKAMKEFRAAFEISPGYLAPRIELTKLLFEQKNKKEVQDQLSLLKEIAPDYYEVLQLEGEKYRLDGKQEKALELFALAHEKMPSTRNMLILARQMLSMGDRQASRQLQESWVEEHPQDSLARLELARLYITDNEEKLAQEQYSAVLAIDKQNLLALNNLAWLLRETDTKRALEYAEEAVRLEPKSAAALDTLAVVQSKTGNHLKAQRSIERALEIFPGTLPFFITVL